MHMNQTSSPNKESPSIRQILWTDYTAFFTALIPIVAWIVFLAWAPDWRRDGQPILNPQLLPFALFVNLALTLAPLVILIRRIGLFFRVFRDGSQVRGRIAEISIQRDRGRVEYTYLFGKEEYRSSATIHRNKQTLALKKGDRVVLLVDPKNPEMALIRDLYVQAE